MQAFLMAPLSALAVVLMFRTIRRLTRRRSIALFSALLYAFATPVFYRTAQLNHNLILAHFAFFSFLLLWRPARRKADGGQPPYYFLAGLLAGWTVVLDYSGVVTLLALGAYALARHIQLPANLRSRSDLPRFAAGALLSLLVLVGYQWVCFGNPIYPAQHYMPATTLSPKGYSGH